MTARDTMEWADTYRTLKRRSWAVLILLTCFSLFFRDPSLSLGVVLGGLAVIVNFDVLQRYILRAFSTREAGKVRKVWVVGKFYLRFLILGAVLFLLIRLRWVDPIGLGAGLSTVVLSIVSFGIHNAFKSTTGEAT